MFIESHDVHVVASAPPHTTAARTVRLASAAMSGLIEDECFKAVFGFSRACSDLEEAVEQHALRCANGRIDPPLSVASLCRSRAEAATTGTRRRRRMDTRDGLVSVTARAWGLSVPVTKGTPQ
jgi:hypothetical protein